VGGVCGRGKDAAVKDAEGPYRGRVESAGMLPTRRKSMPGTDVWDTPEWLNRTMM
jgi:hypothetical protein